MTTYTNGITSTVSQINPPQFKFHYLITPFYDPLRMVSSEWPSETKDPGLEDIVDTSYLRDPLTFDLNNNQISPSMESPDIQIQMTRIIMHNLPRLAELGWTFQHIIELSQPGVRDNTPVLAELFVYSISKSFIPTTNTSKDRSKYVRFKVLRLI
jgi:hypothetical protein